MLLLILLVLGVLVMGILLIALGSFIESRDQLRQQRETLEVRRRAAEAKRELDAEAFKVAQGIQQTILRHGGRS